MGSVLLDTGHDAPSPPNPAPACGSQLEARRFSSPLRHPLRSVGSAEPSASMLASTPTISTAAAVTLTYPPWILARSVTRRVPPNNTVKRQPGTSQPIDAFGDMVREPDPRIHVPGVSAVVVFGGITHGSVVEDKLPIPPSSSQLVTIEPFERGRGGGSPAWRALRTSFRPTKVLTNSGSAKSVSTVCAWASSHPPPAPTLPAHASASTSTRTARCVIRSPSEPGARGPSGEGLRPKLLLLSCQGADETAPPPDQSPDHRNAVSFRVSKRWRARDDFKKSAKLGRARPTHPPARL